MEQRNRTQCSKQRCLSIQNRREHTCPYFPVVLKTVDKLRTVYFLPNNIKKKKILSSVKILLEVKIKATQ